MRIAPERPAKRRVAAASRSAGLRAAEPAVLELARVVLHARGVARELDRRSQAARLVAEQARARGGEPRGEPA